MAPDEPDGFCDGRAKWVLSSLHPQLASVYLDCMAEGVVAPYDEEVLDCLSHALREASHAMALGDAGEDALALRAEALMALGALEQAEEDLATARRAGSRSRDVRSLGTEVSRRRKTSPPPRDYLREWRSRWEVVADLPLDLGDSSPLNDPLPLAISDLPLPPDEPLSRLARAHCMSDARTIAEQLRRYALPSTPFDAREASTSWPLAVALVVRVTGKPSNHLHKEALVRELMGDWPPEVMERCVRPRIFAHELWRVEDARHALWKDVYTREKQAMTSNGPSQARALGRAGSGDPARKTAGASGGTPDEGMSSDGTEGLDDSIQLHAIATARGAHHALRQMLEVSPLHRIYKIGGTMLHTYATEGKWRVLELLLACGADPQQRGAGGPTALQHLQALVRQVGLPSDHELRQGVSKALEILATYSNSPRQATPESSPAAPADAVEPAARERHEANDPPVSASKKKREKAKARKAAAALAAPCRPDEPTASAASTLAGGGRP